MILNGITKEKFLEWLSKTYDLIHYDNELWFKNEKEITQDALLIEFFDSVGIYIEIIRNEGYFDYVVMEEWDYGFESRKEATIQAIKKANEIYNARYSKQKQRK